MISALRVASSAEFRVRPTLSSTTAITSIAMYVTTVRHSGHIDDDRHAQNPVMIAGIITMARREPIARGTSTDGPANAHKASTPSANKTAAHANAFKNGRVVGPAMFVLPECT